MRVKGQKGHNDETSVLFISALHRAERADGFRERGRAIKLFRGEEIEGVCRGDDDLYAYYVEDGALEVGLFHGRDRLAVLFVRGPGDMVLADCGCMSFGESRLILHAVRNTVLVGLTRGQVRELVREDDSFFNSLLYAQHMAGAQMAHRIATSNHQSGSKRIILWLQRLCEANEADGEGTCRVPCNLTVDELSGVLGLHYGTCNKLLKALKDLGVLEKTRTHLIIRDRDRLQELFLEENPVLY